MRKSLSETIRTVDNNLVSNMCSIISGLIPKSSARLHDDFLSFKKFLEKIFVFAIT